MVVLRTSPRSGALPADAPGPITVFTDIVLTGALAAGTACMYVHNPLIPDAGCLGAFGLYSPSTGVHITGNHHAMDAPNNDPTLALSPGVAWGAVLALGVDGATIEDNTCDAGTCAHDANGNPPPLVTAGVDPRFMYTHNLFMQDNTGWQGTSACIGPLRGCSAGPTSGGTWGARAGLVLVDEFSS